MKKNYLLLLIAVFSLCVNAQNEGRIWYFGRNAGLNFNTTPPTPLSDGALNSFEGCTTISDPMGNLLFYSDGTTVWNRNHVPMVNGTGLLGNSSSAQSAMIIPDEQVPNRYFIVTISPQGAHYSVIDMSQDGGLGTVVAGRKNLSIRTGTHEKVTAIPGSAGSDIVWLVLFDLGQYHAYRVGGGIINLQSVVTSTIPLSDIIIDRRGQLKASPDGTKIINTSIGISTAILTSFNNSTGVVSNAIPLTTSTIHNRFYGAEFSPNSNFVYLNGNNFDTGNGCGTTNQREILQYNINGSAGWYSNPIPLGGSTGANSGRGSLQLAPNGKIYFARTCQPWLGSIDNPNLLGTAANYIDNAIQLAPNTTSREGLPNHITAKYAEGSNIVNGQVKIDTNGNGCDPTDLNFTNLLVLRQTSTVSNFDFSDLNGIYNFNVINGQHTITPNPENPTYWNFSPPSATVNFPTQPSPQTRNFCVTANGSIQDLEVIVVPLELARPGFVTDYKVIVKNKGNVTTSGTVSLDFEEDFMTLFSTTPTAGNTPSNRLNWSFSNLQPFQMEEFLFSMTLNTPTQAINPLNGGTRLLFTGNVSILTGTDALPTDNTMTLDQLVVNSFDPNDKTCLEGETIDPSQVGEYVHYLIRFENTGTASAINVVIKDIIDTAKFDLNTLIPLGGSHDYYTRIREGNIVEFIHEDINLDFNDATNDGYVLFKIKTLTTLVSGDTFNNQASIYFDFNFPIITNIESVLVQATAGISETTDSSITMYPNPATDHIVINAGTGIKEISITDLHGRTISSTIFTGNHLQQIMTLDHLTSGIYFVSIQSESGKKVEKLVKK